MEVSELPLHLLEGRYRQYEAASQSILRAAVSARLEKYLTNNNVNPLL